MKKTNLKKLSNPTFEGIVIHCQGLITDFNLSFEKMIGYSSEELIGKNILNLLIPEKYHTIVSNNFNKNFTLPYEIEGIRKDGSLFPLEIETRVIQSEGNKHHRVTSFRDITERVTAERSLIISEEKFEMLLESSEDMISMHSLDGTYLYYNGPSYYNLTKEEVLGKTPYDFFEKEKADILANIIKSVGKTGKSENLEIQLNWFGEMKWFSEYLYSMKGDKERGVKVVKVSRDITKRKKVEEDLIIAKERAERNEKELLRAQELARIGSCYLDLESDQITLSSEVYKMYRLDPSIPLPLFAEFKNLHTPESWNLLSVAIESTIKTGDPFELELRTLKKDGSKGWIWALGEVVRDSNEKIIALRGLIQDVSVRKHSEEELIVAKERAERNEKELLSSRKLARIGSWHLDLESDQITWSSELYKMYGLDSSIPAPLYPEFKNLHTPESWNLISVAIENTIKTGDSYELELRTIKKDGSKGWVWTLGEVVKDSNEKVIALRGMAQDISVRKHSEEEKKKLVDKFDLVNEELDFQTEEIEKKGDELDIAIEKLDFQIEEKEKRVDELDIANEELNFQTDEKEKREEELLIANKELLFQNQEKEKQAIELTKARDNAEESDRLKTEFLNNMSHEIRTPMNSILGFSEFLNDPHLENKKRKSFVKIIQNSGNQLLRVIDDIIEISKLETKQVKLKEEKVNLNDLLLELFSVFDPKAKESQISLHLERGLSDTKSIILLDSLKLHKVLNNLLENALKFTNEGKINFGYKLENNKLEFFVSDTGIGIPKGKNKIIFKRFSQADKELSKKVGGLGLGLSIAKENVMLLGGDINVESKMMRGSTFRFNIPFNPFISDIKIDNNKLDDEKEFTFLIVEDEEINFMFIEILLLDKIKINCRIIHAINGKEAVEICENNTTIDLVLMDLKMPIMNGFEATRLIKKFRPSLPIIAQTAYTSEEDRKKAKEAGCNDFISKPIKKEILKKTINNFIKTNLKKG
jgi:PAS domain S-box-containing protein